MSDADQTPVPGEPGGADASRPASHPAPAAPAGVDAGGTPAAPGAPRPSDLAGRRTPIGPAGAAGSAPRRAAPDASSPSASPSPAGNSSRRVVVAEDEALIRLDLVEMLREQGYDVVGEAGDGEAAVALAEQLRPDLVILDVKMPVLDGISAAERIVAARIAPVVILTAFSQRELVERARDAGAMAYLVKPFTQSDLVPAIEMAVTRHLELVQLEREVADLQGRLETRKLVDRAKGVLQTVHRMTEPEAFRWIQKTSMDRRLTMREVAQVVVAELGPAAAPGAGPGAAAAPGGAGGGGAGPGAAAPERAGSADPDAPPAPPA